MTKLSKNAWWVGMVLGSAKTRGEGEFLITATGERKWTKNAWRTRVASAADVKLGAHVFAFDASGSDNVYRPPQDRIEAIHGNWFVAKVTDTGEAFKGIVTVSGGYRVQIKGLRVPVKVVERFARADGRRHEPAYVIASRLRSARAA